MGSKAGGRKAKKGRAKKTGRRSFTAGKFDSKGLRLTKYIVVRAAVVCFVALMAYTAYLDVSIRKQFEGQKWALPAHVYTRPMELYVGQEFDRGVVLDELRELGYAERRTVDRVGRYRITSSTLSIYQREFRFWDGYREQQEVRISLQEGKIAAIEVENNAAEVFNTEIIRLEPRLFGSVSPMSHEDRSLLRLEDVPTALIEGLIANEDRAFRSHFGVNPLGIARAMIRNVRAGRVVQGGSTLTQQLVKNYYLSSEVSFRRKFVEMIMAVLIEVHYSKDEILQAYLNEVFLSQAGNRAIHGFGLASQYFFARPLKELDIDQLALLVAINNGPSKYNPIRNPNNALQRRDLVLRTMFEQNVISEDEFQAAINAPINVSASAKRAAPLSYPAFMGFVRNNLQNDYQQEDLSNDGLQIHTTLNPRIQQSLVSSVKGELAAIEKRKNIEAGSLQVAAVVIRTDNGEVSAMIGDRNAGFSGYNRAVQARRPVGSLLKPFVYLTALEIPEEYSLATPIIDKAIVVSQKGSPDWKPQNYDGREHGLVMLVDALARSYNLATVQLGMKLGVPQVASTIRRVGYHETFSELPSVLLGAVPMTVMDVGQLYLTLASGGFKTPIKGVRSVLSNEDEPLARYALDIEQVVKPEFNYLINFALQEVVRTGTARSVLTGFRYDYGLAGKTGTTDEYRDSWFAGFSGNYLTVVWIGRDDNKSTGLTGASGAAKVWAKTMQQIPLTRLELGYSDEIITKRVYYSENPSKQDCRLSRYLPVLQASLPLENLPCANRIQYDLGNDDEAKHFEPNENSTNKTKKKSFWQRIFGKNRKDSDG
ncbi:MAG: penicillin-binding protein 1B [Cryomorphaceae bacterium]